MTCVTVWPKSNSFLTVGPRGRCILSAEGEPYFSKVQRSNFLFELAHSESDCIGHVSSLPVGASQSWKVFKGIQINANLKK